MSNTKRETYTFWKADHEEIDCTDSDEVLSGMTMLEIQFMTPADAESYARWLAESDDRVTIVLTLGTPEDDFEQAKSYVQTGGGYIAERFLCIA